MELITVIIVLAICGVLLWALFKYVPMDADIQKVIKVVAIVGVILYVLKVFGIWAWLGANL